MRRFPTSRRGAASIGPVLVVLLGLALPSAADLHPIGHEFRPTAQERAGTDPCVASDGTKASLAFVCNTPGCGHSPLGKLYAEWRNTGGDLVDGPVLVAEGSYNYGVSYTCAPDGALGVVLGASMVVVDRDGPRGVPSAICDLVGCYSGYGISASQDGFLLAWSMYGSGLHGRFFDADGLASSASFLLDGLVSRQVGRFAGILTADGDALIAWQADNPSSIRTAVVRSDRSVVPAITISEFPHINHRASLALRVESVGRFFVAWENRELQAGWVARRVIEADVVPTTSTTTTTLDAATAFLPAQELGTPPFGSDQYTVDRPDLAADDEGRWLAKWADQIPGDPWPHGGPRASSSTDDARQWTAPLPFRESSDWGNDASAVVGNGHGVVLDLYARSGNWDVGHALLVRRSNDGGLSWSEDAPIFEFQSVADESEMSHIVVVPGADGRWVAAWTEYIGAYVWCSGEDPDCVDYESVTVLRCAIRNSISSDDGLTWSAAETLADGVCWGGADLQVATDGNGVWTAIWSDWKQPAILGAVSLDDGETWSSSRAVVADVETANSSLALVANQDGRWALAFSRQLYDDAAGWPDGSYVRVFVSRSDDPAGEWSEPAGIAPWHDRVEGRDLFPSLASNDDGTFAASWSTHSADSGLDPDIVAAFSDDGGATWSDPRVVDSTASMDGRKDFAPRILANGAVWAVIWRTMESGSFTIRFARTRGDCGNGVEDVTEECDDANLVEGDGCDTTCLFTGCGSQVVTGDEQCDDGNTDETDDCIDCRSAFCGDGFVHSALEECDDANSVDEDDCLNDCTIARCGDGVVLPGVEECDDGGASGNNDACLDVCEIARCGDGYLLLGTEQCDDGNADNDDGCTRRCRLESDCCFFAKDGLRVTASDALKVLRRAVGVTTRCPLYDCDVSRDGDVSAVDALWTLRSAIGLFAEGCSLPSRLVLRFTSAEKIGALQVRIHYADAAGHIVPKSDGEPDCTSLVSPTVSATNWQEQAGVLTVGFVWLEGVQGPLDVLSCVWIPVSGPSLHDFSVTVQDASGVDSQPVVPPPTLGLTAE